jgi:uncharacterized protein YecT (DUF1311 family)
MSMILLLAMSAAVQLPDYSSFQLSEAEWSRVTSPEYRHCTNDAVSNGDAVECIYTEWDRLDRVLNANYRSAMAKMPNRQARDRLRNAQRVWLRQRDEDCSVENAGGHTAYELALHQCEIDELIRRVAWLKRLSR